MTKDITKRQIISWTPATLKLKVVGEPIDCAYRTLEQAKPNGYTQSVMVKYETRPSMAIHIGVAYGEIDMNQWSVEEQVKMVRKLEYEGWVWA